MKRALVGCCIIVVGLIGANVNADAATSVTWENIATIQVGSRPVHAVYSPDGEYVYEVNWSASNLYIIDASTNFVEQIVSLPFRPSTITISPDGSRLYLSPYTLDGNFIDIFDTASRQIVGRIPFPTRAYISLVSPDGTKLYVSHDVRADHLSVVDLNTNEIAQTIDCGWTTGVTVMSSDGSRIYTANNSNKTISVIDTATSSTTSTIQLDSAPYYGMAISPDGSRLYVGINPSGVLIIDTETEEAIETIPFPHLAYSLMVTPDGTDLFMVDVTSGSGGEPGGKSEVWIYNTISGEITSVPTGYRPFNITISPDGQKAFIPNNGDNTVTVIQYKGPSNLPPVADAGAEQTSHIGTVVTLDGSASYDPDEDYLLSFSWNFASLPPDSAASLNNANTVNPSFTADAPGDYYINLVVTDSEGLSSAVDQVVVSTYNAAPVADAGSDQAIGIVGTPVTVDGCQSYDEDDDYDVLTYYWELVSPPGSNPSPYSPTPCTFSFIADIHADYVVNLSVSDPWIMSESVSVIVSFDNVKPVAIAGNNQSCVQGDTIYLDGSGSSDENLDNLEYHWSLVSKPDGSFSVIGNPSSMQASFTADLPGTYIVSLVVDDGFDYSDPSNITVVAITFQNAATDLMQEVIAAVNSLPPDVFKNRNLSKALTNKVNAALSIVDEGQYEEAYDKFVNDILSKTDGCAFTGEPDKNDWLRDCSSQGNIYPLVTETIGLLLNLL